MTREERRAIVAELSAIEVEAARRESYKWRRYFTDCLPGCKPRSLRAEDHIALDPMRPPTCRVLYVKHMQFVAAGLAHAERLFLAANRIGKTDVAAFEIAAHMTGLYPPWWHGRRFDRPTRWWAAGDTMQTTRDIVQVALMGPIDGVDTRAWTGMLPAHLVHDVSRKSGGVPKCLDQVWVRHVSGELSVMGFKSYDMGRRSFQGTELDGVWLDEEPSETEDVYTECLLRTMTTGGMIISTYTPLKGLTPFLDQWLDTAVMADASGESVPAKQVFWPGQAA